MKIDELGERGLLVELTKRLLELVGALGAAITAAVLAKRLWRILKTFK